MLQVLKLNSPIGLDLPEEVPQHVTTKNNTAATISILTCKNFLVLSVQAAEIISYHAL